MDREPYGYNYSAYHHGASIGRPLSAASSTSTAYSLPSSASSPRESSHRLTSRAPAPTSAPTNTMRRANTMAEIPLPITYTPTTHRISKAKKGKRVHACEFPGCNKVFTRAEHRRRHELNHNPEASFPCTYDGCRKAFHRSDLLARHMERQYVSLFRTFGSHLANAYLVNWTANQTVLAAALGDPRANPRPPSLPFPPAWSPRCLWM